MNGKPIGLQLTTAIVTLAALVAPAAASAAAATGTQGVWGWWDAAIWAGALSGIVGLAFWGDVLLGAFVYAVAVAVTALVSTPVRWARNVRRPRPGIGHVPTAQLNRKTACLGSSAVSASSDALEAALK